MYIMNSMHLDTFPENTVFDGVLTKDIINDWVYCIFDVRMYKGTQLSHLSHTLRLVCAFMYVIKDGVCGNFEIDCLWPRPLTEIREALDSNDYHVEGFVITDGLTVYKWNYVEKVRGALEMLFVNGEWQLASVDGTIMDKRKDVFVPCNLAECLYHDGEWIVVRECTDRMKAQSTEDLRRVQYASNNFISLEEMDRLVK